MFVKKEFFETGKESWLAEFKKYKYFILISLAVVGIATYADYLSGTYVSSTRVADVPDLILDHIGPYDLSFLFVYGYLALVLLLFLNPLIFHIGKLHKVIGQFSLLIFIRSFFIIFTHLQTPLDAVYADFPWSLEGLSFINDLFFSGHVAVPFLGFLLFRKDAGSFFKYFFLISSIVMGATVLLMHQHYSIDVFAAFFITYTSYRFGEFIFRKVNPKF